MSGKAYGSIQVRQETDADDGETSPAATSHHDAAATTERIPLLSAVTQEKKLPSPPLFSSVSVAVQTDPTKFTIALRYLTKIWSDTTFDWISPLLETGNANGQLNLEDLDELPLPDDCETSQVYARFWRCWTDELEKARFSDSRSSNDNNGDTFRLLAQPTTTITTGVYQPSLIKALARAFGGDFLRAGLLKLIHDANIFVGPQVLNHLIQFLRNADAPFHQGAMLTVLVTVSQIAMSISLRHYFYKCYTCGLQVRTAVVLAVYKKSLQLSLKERHSFGNGGGAGEIVNLVGIDAQRMQDLMTYLHAVWYSFFQIGLAMYFLWGQVGASCLAGVVVIVVLIPVTKFVAGWLSGIQKILMKARDERVSLNNEVMNAMKIIKIQAWEENFRAKLSNLRNIEMLKLRRYFITSAISVSMYSSTPLLVSLATFGAYTMIGQNHLDVAQALTALALFDILRFPLFMLPQIINRIIEASISFERVRKFLLGEEYQHVGEGSLQQNGEISINNGTFVYDSKKPTLLEDEGAKKKGGIRGLMHQQTRLMQEAQLNQQWEMALLRAQLIDAENTIAKLNGTGTISSHSMMMDENAEEGEFSPSSLLSLRRVTMHVKKGEFVAVVGGVGAGKSTLINSILGEGRPLTGTELAVKGTLGTFVQSPFILNDTVRNNILFGHAPISKNGSKDGGGEAIDEERYKLAVEVSSLSHDFTLLPHGDQTEIGEKGITLSGGQKARVALARTVYHDADVYLLDDPLAAVDAHVGKDLFNKCIVDEMLLGKSKGRKSGERNATVILVTNALQYLSHEMVDKIICLEDGRVQEVGTFSELSSDPNSRFSSFLKVLSETSMGAMDTSDDNVDYVEEEDDISASANLDLGGEPEVSKVIDPPPTSPKRKMSIQSVDESAGGGSSDEQKGALMTDELKEREKGAVDRRVYISWSKAAGGLSVGVTILSMFAGVEALQVLSKWWLTHWSQSGGANVVFFLGMYAVINFSAIFATFVRLLLFNFAGLRASKIMFDELLDVILHAPMAFFDTTPIGRIMNRFSKDMYTVDEQLVVSARSYFTTMAQVLSTIVVVTSVTPKFVFGLVPLLFFYLHQQNFFTMTYRELKRLDSVTRSPIYALLSETLDGVLTIRAFGAEENLNKRMINMINIQQTAYRLTYAAQCWLSIRLEFCGTMLVFVACFVSVIQHGSRGGDELFAGLAGLSISFALSITQALNWTVRMASDLEANMVAVERIQQYSQIKSEAPRLTEVDESLPYNWPAEGRIEFINAKLRYRPGLPLVLKGLNISIPAQAKVGVVGRTGAGKSTLMVALLRLVELDSGCIKIDGVDIRSVGLKTLRSKIAVIPQDPVLFSGSVRTNLDPFDEFDDDRLFEVLQHVGLYSSVVKNYSSTSLSSQYSGDSSNVGGKGRAQPIKSLSEAVTEGGTNFSVGQRQLMVIARAMLTGAQVVIMDEATASVDGETDARIQRVFREEFKNATCITVAHRLNTIMDSDLVLVMDDGRAAEFDKPSSLLSREGGLFRALVDASEEER